MPKPPKTLEQKVRQFNNAKPVREILGGNYSLPKDFHSFYEQVFDQIKKYGKSPANGGYTRIARWIKYDVPPTNWPIYNKNILDSAVPRQKGKAITEESFIWSYGEIEGKKRWGAYRSKQRKSNLYEAKKEKYGWSEQQYREYNLSRAVTLDNLIRKYGDVVKANEVYSQYIEKQRYTTTKEYFVSTYGETEGGKKFDDWNRSKIETNFFMKSKVEMDFLTSVGGEFPEIKYEPLDVRVENDGKMVYPDAILDDVIVEFNGDFWHFNPKIYEDVLVRYPDAPKKWKKDTEKYRLYLERGYRVIVIWEADWRKHREEVIKQFRGFLNSNKSFFSTIGEEFIDGMRWYGDTKMYDE